MVGYVPLFKGTQLPQLVRQYIIKLVNSDFSNLGKNRRIRYLQNHRIRDLKIFKSKSLLPSKMWTITQIFASLGLYDEWRLNDWGMNTETLPDLKHQFDYNSYFLLGV